MTSYLNKKKNKKNIFCGTFVRTHILLSLRLNQVSAFLLLLLLFGFQPKMAQQLPLNGSNVYNHTFKTTIFTHIKSSVYLQSFSLKVTKRGKIRNRYTIKHPHLTQDTNGRVTNSQLDITNESQEVPQGINKQRCTNA